MELDEYVAARYGRLIEHAVLLGAPEGEAGTYVDRVLLDQRRAIRRSADPDPVVFAALEQALSGQRPPSRSSAPLVALALVVVAAVVGVALAYRPDPEPLPSLFGLDGDQARELLDAQGYDVQLRPSRSCEPWGLVLSSDPVPGSLVREGADVTVRTAAPSGTPCGDEQLLRSDAWAFVRFALGGDPPPFADLVNVVVDRSEPAVMSADDAVRQGRWGGTLEDVARAARQTPPTENGMPALEVSQAVPPAETCGVPRPPEGGEREALRVRVEAGGGGCPLTVDLYRSGQVIDSVVVYTAQP